MLSLRDLEFNIGKSPIVSNINLEVKIGQTLAVLGKNGAGKTSLLKLIAGINAPDKGQISIFENDIIKNRLKALEYIGYLAEGAPLYSEMTPKEYLLFLCKARSINENQVRIAAELTGLQKVFHQKIATLSKGFQRRVGIAGAILHRPKLLILDEPSDGLDPEQKLELEKILKSIKSETIIVFSTHNAYEAEAICDMAIIIEDGKITKTIKTDIAKTANKFFESKLNG